MAESASTGVIPSAFEIFALVDTPGAEETSEFVVT